MAQAGGFQGNGLRVLQATAKGEGVVILAGGSRLMLKMESGFKGFKFRV